MFTNTATVAADPGSARCGRRGQKPRSADCRKCVIMTSLRDAGVPAPTTRAICNSMWLNGAQRRQMIYAEGNGATHLYAIRSGRVKLFKDYFSGRACVTAVLESGDLFGFEAIFDDAYDGYAEALTDCELCLASADRLKQLVREVPSVGTDLARYLHRQLRRARDRQVAVAATGAAAKLAAYLVHSLEWSDEEDDGDPMVAHDLTLGDLGGILGMSPETACRVLSDLRARGMVENQDEGIRLRDVDGLRRMARI